MFKRLAGAKEASTALLERCRPVARQDPLALENSAGRVLSHDILSEVDLPGFNRAAMDGYAVRSKDTRSASALSPAYLALGQECIPIRTGMQVPEGFDAVVMLEDAVRRDGQIEVTTEVHPFRNVSRIGEDIARGDLVLKEGHRLRPPDLALLAALGISEVRVYALPKVTIIPTGGELVPRGSRPLKPGEVYETNALMADLYVSMWGGCPRRTEIIPDDKELISKAIESGLDSEMILILGGTSVGEKDYAPGVLSDLGELLVHGVRVQPGKPTALGAVEGVPVACLPGYPVAALSALYLFVRPAIKKMAHLTDAVPVKRARLARKIASRPGYLSIVRVSLKDEQVVPIMSSGAGILSSVARADGLVIVPEELEGLEAGEMVDVEIIE
ncbi:MAG TPA: gephyrin-like molybdotransferase Glp [Methanotrichaceae archaeon]|nr:gephyrin-like molybdotransferase Glp [Methanotrichaceae archaeon]